MNFKMPVTDAPLPSKFADLKREIAASIPDFERKATQAWSEIISQLKSINEEIRKSSSEVAKYFYNNAPSQGLTPTQYIPQVNFQQLKTLSQEQIESIKRKGSVVIKDVIPDEQAAKWKEDLTEFVTNNPDVDGRVLDHPVSR
jgi:D-ribose pyranose/furanose isomerase RbsD